MEDKAPRAKLVIRNTSGVKPMDVELEVSDDNQTQILSMELNDDKWAWTNSPAEVILNSGGGVQVRNASPAGDDVQIDAIWLEVL